MSDETRIGAVDVEYRIQNGEEFHAVWLPISSEEKEALFEKGKTVNADMPALAAAVLRGCLLEAELTEDQLDQISGGPIILACGGVTTINSSAPCTTYPVWNSVYGRYYNVTYCR